MSTPTPPPPPTAPNGRKCIVCKQPRLAGLLLDAIQHAPCDQGLVRLDPHNADEVDFWEAAGAAG